MLVLCSHCSLGVGGSGQGWRLPGQGHWDPFGHSVVPPCFFKTALWRTRNGKGRARQTRPTSRAMFLCRVHGLRKWKGESWTGENKDHPYLTCRRRLALECKLLNSSHEPLSGVSRSKPQVRVDCGQSLPSSFGSPPWPRTGLWNDPKCHES